MRQDKIARVFMISLYALVAIVTLYFCITPLKPAVVHEQDFNMKITNTVPREAIISGSINNRTKYKVKKIQVVISIYDGFEYLPEETIEFDVDIDARKAEEFYCTKTISVGRIEKFKVESIKCVYEKLPWPLVGVVGIFCAVIIRYLFEKRKYYFNIEDKKVVIFVNWKQIDIIVDGVIIKEGKLPKFKAEVSLYNIKIAGHKLKIYVLNGDVILPRIRALIDDNPIEYTKVRQNIFVKLMDEGVIKGKGNITMRSQYEIDGEAADEYNKKRFNKNKLEDASNKNNAKESITCSYCGSKNNKKAKKCSCCNAELE